MRVGLISDTHGLLRPQAVQALQGVDHIVHAGDIGAAAVLEALRGIAPVTAVRGNNDKGEWAAALPDDALLECAGVHVYVLHDLHELGRDARAEGLDVIVAGHSHRPSVTVRDEILYVNPGSAGPRRFKLPVALALLEIAAGRAQARIELLDV